MKKMVITVIVIQLIIVISIGCIQEKQKEFLVKINSFKIDDENPSTLQQVNGTVTMENFTNWEIIIVGEYTGLSSEKIDKNNRSFSFTCPETDTILWISVIARGINNDCAIVEKILEVGEFFSLNTSAFDISNVYNIPQNPTVEDQQIKVYAELINHSDNYAWLRFYYITIINCTNRGLGHRTMSKTSDDIYECIFDIKNIKGANVYYKILALDEYGNYVLSPTYNFRIS